uniref:Rna-directed dna polymerase from mobile element jockey-like protein n=1 Tax=Triatoma infestans TaxID=30076 RepID=A0A161MG88_TRIIF
MCSVCVRTYLHTLHTVIHYKKHLYIASYK